MDTFEIWASDPSKKGGEAGLFMPSICTKEQYHFLTHDTDGDPMILRKRFKASSWDNAKKVYKKMFGF